MLKKIIFLSFCLIKISIFAGDSEDNSDALSDWIVIAKTIKIQTGLKGLLEIAINQETTVLDVKNSLYESEGIPVYQQTLKPLFTSWWNLKLFDKHGVILSNDSEYIKDVMQAYNTDRFLLYLTLKYSQKMSITH